MKVKILNHPLVKHKVSIIRNKKTGTKEFREIINELAILIAYEALQNLKLYEDKVKTPICETSSYMINENDYAFIPILRAGLSMVDGVIKLIPNAKIGHIGLYRDENTLEAVRYYYKAPKGINNKEVFLLDPMIATGNSATEAITMLKKEGVNKINLLGIIAAPEGIRKINIEHPDVKIVIAALDEKLNENGYIVPGLGDAGDRIFGTK